jgi:hypothetical protein
LRFGEIFGKASAVALILINPNLHQLKEKSAGAKFKKETEGLFDDYPSLVPAFKITSGTSLAQCQAFLKAYKGTALAIVYSSPGLTDAEIKVLALEPRIKYHVILNDKVTAEQLAQTPVPKRIFIRDNFNKQARIADYAGPELFSDQHKTFAAKGLGFGDYTVVGSVFQDSGSTPSAVAIHALYKHPATGDLWVEHFVSDQKERDVGDVASKFIQAAKKLTLASKKRAAEFGSNVALDSYASQVKASSYPGLGKNKEQQLVHHLSLTIDVLTGLV